MKAMVLHTAGQPLKLEDVAMPVVGPNGVLVRVRACGIGLTVVKAVARAEGRQIFPRIPGHEIGGDVVAVGSEVRSVKAGDRVTNHYYMTCGQCAPCRSGRETLCLHPSGQIGAACNGGYAEYVALPERNIIAIPDGVSYVEAGVAADAIATPYHACHEEARVRPGDQVLIVGAGGGVGIHMVQMARLCGARVIAADIGDDKLALAKKWGADETIDARHGDLADQVRAATGGIGVNAAIDMVGSPETLDGAIRALATLGRMVIIGSRLASGTDSKLAIDLRSFQTRGLELHSSRYVNAGEIIRTLEIVRQKRITPVVTQTFALEQVEAAHELIRNNATAGRLAMVIEA
jgi:D-arabinose 1-dehydrogenase-like Zn-dependent alcohol dehydrogenase